MSSWQTSLGYGIVSGMTTFLNLPHLRLVAGCGVAGATVLVVQGGGVPGQRAGGKTAGQQGWVGHGGLGAGWQRGLLPGVAPRRECRPVAGIEAAGLQRFRCVTALPLSAAVRTSAPWFWGGRSRLLTGRGQSP